MKTLARILFVLTILISSYSCSSEDPTPITISNYKLELSNIDYSGSKPKITISVGEKLKNDIKIKFIDDLSESVTLKSGTNCVVSEIDTSSASGKVIEIESINGINEFDCNDVVAPLCENSLVWKVISSKINKINIINTSKIDGYCIIKFVCENNVILSIKYINENPSQLDLDASYIGLSIIGCDNKKIYFDGSTGGSEGMPYMEIVSN